MAELGKVIYSIERCICHVPDACRDCGYDNEPCPKCFEHLLRDAHDLLKAQDETRLIYHYSRPNVYADLWLHCEKCGEKVDNKWRPKYCPGCGRAVKWE